MNMLSTADQGAGGVAVAVMVVGASDETLESVANGLGALAQISPSHAVPYREAEAVAWVERPRIVLMDFDRNIDKAMDLGPVLLDMLPGVLLVAMSSRGDPERIRTAMRAGYREYVVIPDDLDILRRTVQQVTLESEALEEQRGSVIALCGAKGGVGVTSITVNLAAEIAQRLRVLAIDMVYGMGDLAVLLDLKPSEGMAELLKNLGRLDDRVLEACTTMHASQALVLPQPEDAQTYEPPAVDAILRVLHVAARSFPCVLLDCGTCADEQALTAIVTADEVVLVTTPEVPALRDAWRRLRLFDRLGVERDRIRLVVNRWSRSAPVTRRDIESNLGMPIFASLSDDPKVLYNSVNYGRTFADVNTRAAITKEIKQLAAHLGNDVPVPQPAPKRGFFR
jgi:pilus assembly protein CpaE